MKNAATRRKTGCGAFVIAFRPFTSDDVFWAFQRFWFGENLI
jgi:hypothetical protein